ncbi:MAG TPA: cysteine--tRNA ligase [Verrucomicrobiales bacterium]|nr:cysteine--tRNA ligase [Verrucomicrobiales bacterium]
MSVRLFDSLSRSIRELKPLDGETFRFYCCGPTVYGPAHVGNFRTFVLQDTLRRVLEASGMATRHVRNITDVDDKTIRQSRAEGRTLADFTAEWTRRFHADAAALQLLPPHVEPSAVEHVPHQIRMIVRLIDKGHAYCAEDGSVYFRVTSFPGYGRLTRLDERELRTGPGQAAQAADEYGKDALADFALWKARRQEDGENFWESPWGEGRPGWHLECSAMSIEYLGESFDLHSGGIDLMFPHHENEIAQSECCTGRTFAAHWHHVAHLMVDGGKMSKSLGNLYTLDDLSERGFSPLDLRYIYLSGHYRKPLNFTFEALAAAQKAVAGLVRAERKLAERAGLAPQAMEDERGRCEDWASFEPAWEALCDDLNTPEALGRAFTALRELPAETSSATEARREWRALRTLLAIMGLGALGYEKKLKEAPAEIRDLADRRWAARQARDWVSADAMREELAQQGWTMKDGRESYELMERR